MDLVRRPALVGGGGVTGRLEGKRGRRSDRSGSRRPIARREIFLQPGAGLAGIGTGAGTEFPAVKDRKQNHEPSHCL